MRLFRNNNQKKKKTKKCKSSVSREDGPAPEFNDSGGGDGHTPRKATGGQVTETWNEVWRFKGGGLIT